MIDLQSMNISEVKELFEKLPIITREDYPDGYDEVREFSDEAVMILRVYGRLSKWAIYEK